MRIVLLSLGLLAGTASAQPPSTPYTLLKMRCQVAAGPSLTGCKVVQTGGADQQRQQGLIYVMEHTPPDLPADTPIGSTVEREVRLMQTARPIPLPPVH